jgi:RimJ/RimL family protein N-acetyltransferase
MVRLVPMTEEDFASYFRRAVPEYAQEHVAAGNWSPAEAQQRAEKEFRDLLPQGVASPDQHLFTILGAGDDGEETKVGMVWFAVDPKRPRPFAWVYDFLVQPEYRRRGYGRAAFLALEDQVRALGLARIELHVFGHNLPARAVYESLGYEVTNLILAKKVG